MSSDDVLRFKVVQDLVVGSKSADGQSAWVRPRSRRWGAFLVPRGAGSCGGLRGALLARSASKLR